MTRASVNIRLIFTNAMSGDIAGKNLDSEGILTQVTGHASNVTPKLNRDLRVKKIGLRLLQSAHS